VKEARRQAREVALQALYAWQLSRGDAIEQMEGARGLRRRRQEARRENRARRLPSAAPSLQALISPYLDRAFERLSPVERAILYIGSYELSAQPGTPFKVVLNEAVELGKSFGGTEGHRFVNGVLEKIAAALRPEEFAIVEKPCLSEFEISEFEIIRRFFTRAARSAVQGIGDDCARIRVSEGAELAISTDMLVEGRHFAPGAEPRALGHKALAVNLSDLAAAGATPRWITLALALPTVDESWLKGFSEGLFALADRHGVELIGGDTTRGPLTIDITAFGEGPGGRGTVARRRAAGRRPVGLRRARRRRARARASGDRGRGEAPARARAARSRSASGCAGSRTPQSTSLMPGRRPRPHPRALGRGGGRALRAHPPGCRFQENTKSVPRGAMRASGGDDYELLFTAGKDRRALLESASKDLGLELSPIGEISGQAGTLVVLDKTAIPMSHRGGYDHFRAP